MVWMAGLDRRYPKRLFRWNGSGVVVRRRISSAAARLTVYGAMSLADAAEPLPLIRMDALPSPPEPEPEPPLSMLYLRSGSLPPLARPSDALRNRNRSLSRHLRLPLLPQPRISEAAPRGDGGDEGNSSSMDMESPLYGERDRVARLLRDETLEEEVASAGLPDLPLV
jgi:hypothetical protein